MTFLDECLERSRSGVSITIPEPQCDIDAQLGALLKPDHPKDCVFLALGNDRGDFPANVFVERRPEGSLLTIDAAKAETFRSADKVTDAMLAKLLDYPCTKTELMDLERVFAVQARDAAGNVIYETVCDDTRYQQAIEIASRHGHLHITTPIAALERRVALLKG
jgi:hypothetical protein